MTRFDERYFAANMITSAAKGQWDDVVDHAASAEAVHGGQTAFRLALCWALHGESAPQQHLTTAGAPRIAALYQEGHVHSFVDAAWRASPFLGSGPRLTPGQLRPYVQRLLPLTQTFADNVRADNSDAASVFNSHVHPATGTGTYEPAKHGLEGREVMVRALAYSGILLSAAVAATHT